MTTTLPKACSCGGIIRQGRCSRCNAGKEGRPSAAKRGYDAKWKAARQAYLDENPLCVMCHDQHIINAATVVDHKVPHNGDPGLFWSRLNWQGLCEAHHNAKSGKGE